MIDLQCHLLDGVSCGPESFDDSIEVCRSALKDGVRTIVATPRWSSTQDEPPLPFAVCHHKLQKIEASINNQIALKLGFLIEFSSRLPSLIERYNVNLTLSGGRYVLVALPSTQTPTEAEAVWEAIKESGYSVIVARPECSLDLRSNNERLKEWVTNGLLLQIDAASIVGAYGRAAQRAALQLVEGYPQHVVVASNSRDGRFGYSSLALARKELLRKITAPQAHVMMYETPFRIINGDQSTTDSGIKSQRHSLQNLFNSLRSPKAQTGAS